MAIAFLVLLGLAAALWVWLAISPVHRLTFRQALTADPGAAGPAAASAGAAARTLPPVTLVVPARNEAAMLPAMAPTWCRQVYPDFCVVVVDDQSEDDTPKVLERLSWEFPNLKAVRAGPRPPGWTGKPWAVTQGVAAAATTDWLMFTDADCAFHPQTATRAVGFAQANGLDMLSLLPRLTCESAAERIGVSGLVTTLGLMFPTGWANDPKRALALAAGGFILVRRDAYEKVGGHASVKSHMIEDINLARKFKAVGAKVHVRLTPDLVTTRMYEGWVDMWEGLTKNAYAGMEYQPRKFWVGLPVALLFAVLPPLYLLVSLLWAWRTPSSASAWVAVALSALINVTMAAVHWRTVRFLRLPPWHALLMPLSMGLYLVIASASAWQHHFGGGNVWKGRRYDRTLLLSDTATTKDQAAGVAPPT